MSQRISGRLNEEGILVPVRDHAQFAEVVLTPVSHQQLGYMRTFDPAGKYSNPLPMMSSRIR